jgi:hypothetical protein
MKINSTPTVMTAAGQTKVEKKEAEVKDRVEVGYHPPTDREIDDLAAMAMMAQSQNKKEGAVENPVSVTTEELPKPEQNSSTEIAPQTVSNKPPEITTEGKIAATLMLAGTAAAFSGMWNMGIGLAESSIGALAGSTMGPMGGIAASVLVGSLELYDGLRKKEGIVADFANHYGFARKGKNKVFHAVLDAATGAAATYVGSSMGMAGIFPGAALKGVTHGLVAGTKTMISMSDFIKDEDKK